MTKELSIESIKKELIDRMKDCSEIIDYFSNDEIIKEYGKSKYTNPYLDYLFIPYDATGDGNIYDNFISVEVGKEEQYASETYFKYTVSIIVRLKGYSNLDKLSKLIEDIISELYPNRRNYRNFPFKISGFERGERDAIARKIQFTIE